MTSGGVQVGPVAPVRAVVGALALAALLAGCREECKVDADCGGKGSVCEASQCAQVEVYGVAGRSVQRLGEWPALAEAGTEVFNVVAPEDRSHGALFPNGYLVSNGTH